MTIKLNALTSIFWLVFSGHWFLLLVFAMNDGMDFEIFTRKKEMPQMPMHNVSITPRQHH